MVAGEAAEAIGGPHAKTQRHEEKELGRNPGSQETAKEEDNDGEKSGTQPFDYAQGPELVEGELRKENCLDRRDGHPLVFQDAENGLTAFQTDVESPSKVG